MPEPRVAILLLNWNGWKDTIECLESVFRLEYPNFFVVLCDNASTDDSVERIREWTNTTSPAEPDLRRGQAPSRPVGKPIRTVELTRAEAEGEAGARRDAQIILIHNDANLGFAAGNNVGLRFLLRQPDVDYVWILNNDVVVEKSALDAMVACARSDSLIGGVGATNYEYGIPEAIQAAAGGVFSPRHFNPRLITQPRPSGNGRLNGAPTVDFISGACMLVRTDVLRDVGLLDESFYIYCEDVDLGVRIRRSGSTLAYAQAARIWHKGGSTFGHRSLRHDYYTVRNTLAVVRKHYPLMTPFIVAYLTYRTILPKVVRGQWVRLGAAWRGYRDFAKHVSGPAPF